MSEYRELVKGLRCQVTGNLYGTDTWAKVGDKLIPCECSSCQAAQAIERLEDEVQTYIRADHEGAASLAVDLAEAERQLAGARAEIERKDKVLKRIREMNNSHPTKCQSQLSDIVAEALATPAPCTHDWKDMTNEVIQSGEWCPKCNAIRAAPSTGEAERPTLTKPQREILHHTKWRAAGRMYCGAKDDADIQSLVRLGYMRGCGTPGHLPDDEAYFTITETGLKALATQAPSREFMREKIRNAPDLETEAGTMHPEAPSTGEAERPKDWYCGRCSEVVPLRERCRICGGTKRESGVA